MSFVISMHQHLLASGKSLCTAESCTGGRIAALITSMPGSSDYFRGGIVSYQTEIKESVLKVDATIIEKYGVVSRETADAMRTCACKVCDADYAIAITGYAGPTGGTEADPVGTVYISVGTVEQGITKRVVSQFSERTAIQDDVAQQAIDLFNKFLDVEL
ncbi:MAG: CinA family protein [Bacteroidaceae bacterium]|nr:CinA family protein [Bacteroidaceae bacterium]